MVIKTANISNCQAKLCLLLTSIYTQLEYIEIEGRHTTKIKDSIAFVSIAIKRTESDTNSLENSKF